MTQAELHRPICRIFWAYFFIYIDFRLGSFNLLPPWVGYLMLFSLLGTLSVERPTLGLLRPFALVLAGSTAFDWLNDLLGGGLPALPGWLSLSLGLIGMYFHFQLFTDLAWLAEHRGIPPEGEVADASSSPSCRPKGLLAARTVQTLLQTVLLIDPLMARLLALDNLWVAAVVGAYVVVLFVILYQLFALRRRFPCPDQPAGDGGEGASSTAGN